MDYKRGKKRGIAQNSQGDADDLSSQQDDIIEIKEQIFAQLSAQRSSKPISFLAKKLQARSLASPREPLDCTAEARLWPKG